VDVNPRPIRTIERNGPSKKSALAHDGGIIGPDGTAGINSISERRGRLAPIAEATPAVGAPLPPLDALSSGTSLFGLSFLS
jgi:hypothetical protein